MIWRRIIIFALWTALLVGLFFLTGFVALMGDCPEKVIYGWQGGTACSDRKHLIAILILMGFPLLWLAGAIGIFRFRRR